MYENSSVYLYSQLLVSRLFENIAIASNMAESRSTRSGSGVFATACRYVYFIFIFPYVDEAHSHSKRTCICGCIFRFHYYYCCATHTISWLREMNSTTTLCGLFAQLSSTRCHTRDTCAPKIKCKHLVIRIASADICWSGVVLRTLCIDRLGGMRKTIAIRQYSTLCQCLANAKQ